MSNILLVACKFMLPAIGLLAQSSAWAECDDDWLRVDEVRDGSSIKLRATNLKDFPITFSLRVATEDFAVEGSNTITETIHGKDSEHVMVLASKGDLHEGSYRISCDWTVGDQNAMHDDAEVYLFPYAEDASYRLIQAYGSSLSHTGLEQYALDFYMDVGTPVHAARAGVVARIVESNDKGCWERGCGQFANFVVILHNDSTTGEYYHLQKDGALVDVGQHVKAGQRIGLSGETGHVTIPHLHFAVYRAVSRGRTQSVPVRFLSVDGVVDNPRRFARYKAVSFRDPDEAS